MVKTKDQAPAAAKTAAPFRQPAPVRPGPEAAPVRPVFSTEARANGVPASMRAAELTIGAGGTAGRARMAAGMQRSVGNARMARMMGHASGVAAGPASSGKTSRAGGLPAPVQTRLES